MKTPTFRSLGTALSVSAIALVFGLSLLDQLVTGGSFGHAGDGVLGILAALGMAALVCLQPGLNLVDRSLSLAFWISVLLLWSGYLVAGPDNSSPSETLTGGMYLTVPLVLASYSAALVRKVMVAWRRGLVLVALNFAILVGTILMPMYDYPVLFWSTVMVFFGFWLYERARPVMSRKAADEEESD